MKPVVQFHLIVVLSWEHLKPMLQVICTRWMAGKNIDGGDVFRKIYSSRVTKTAIGQIASLLLPTTTTNGKVTDIRLVN